MLRFDVASGVPAIGHVAAGGRLFTGVAHVLRAVSDAQRRLLLLCEVSDGFI
jgi:hypothetical protein